MSAVEQPTPRQIYVRLVAAMIEHDLPTPESITLFRGSLGLHVRIDMPDNDREAVDRWTEVLGIATPKVMKVGSIHRQYETAIGAGQERYSEWLGLRAYVTTRLPDPPLPEPPLPAEDAAAVATIRAEAAGVIR